MGEPLDRRAFEEGGLRSKHRSDTGELDVFVDAMRRNPVARHLKPIALIVEATGTLKGDTGRR
jgi:hypothetical protein